MLARALAYGALGLVVEYAFTRVAGRPKRPSPWMLPVYGLAAPLFEPVHDRLRAGPPVLRALAYGAGICAVEYAAGRALRSVGAAPWDYAGARFAVHGVTRLDYLPLWALYGLALERAHDAMVARP